MALKQRHDTDKMEWGQATGRWLIPRGDGTWPSPQYAKLVYNCFLKFR